ncbi:hypothetical protein PR202_ga19275 [Eleusine coracana subsp. coracana]|uniref:Uncharacterized protein n=1 Tax=Eleusine coracana subsp. coracana TaxID=191504 RepID=A0AAV5CV56_ELECO|nr:hypothetical protein QOZ80_4AG0306460 [Eleusine coracana subsp. coracana]GJN01969.1 hypothetical protein PR202_ga19275 [Eleusine coracana subsp. coracana]
MTPSVARREALLVPLLLLLRAATVALAAVPAPRQQQQELQLQDTLLLDDVVQEAAQEWYHTGRRRKTGVAYPLPLPGGLSGVEVTVCRFRSGSLRRHGARRFGEFSLPPGLAVRGGGAAHLLAVRVNLGDLSSVYDAHAQRAGYRLASPVLGLMFYGPAARPNASATLEVDVTGAAIRVNFSVAVPALRPGAAALCMAVGTNGTVTVTDVEPGSNVCHAADQGHFALVVGGAADDGDSSGAGEAEVDGEASKWKLALFGAALGAGGTVLLGMVAVAVVTVRRRKSEVAELERRAYEEEALRVSMVGHVRALSAAGSRTTPDELETDYCATL